jgi:hypothetical protein
VIESDPDSDDAIASDLSADTAQMNHSGDSVPSARSRVDRDTEDEDVVDGDTEGEDVDMVNAESGASLIDTLARESKLTFE